MGDGVTGESFRMWSWNLDGAFQLGQDVIDFLAEADVDLVLAQEVRPAVSRSGFGIIPPPGPTWGIPDHGKYQTAVLHRGALKVDAVPEMAPLGYAKWTQFGLSTMGRTGPEVAARVGAEGV
jgi:hypothetical protein